MNSIIRNIESFIRSLKADRKFRNNFIITASITFLFFWFLFYLGIEAKESSYFSQAKVHEFITSFGVFSWLIYVGLVFLSVMSPLPDSPTVIVGGYIFGPFVAIPLAIIGQILGASLAFYLARRLGRNYVTGKFPNAISYLDKYNKRLGWQTVFLMRLTPSFSFDFLSFVSGISNIKFKHYVLATLAGMIPLVIITSMLGYGISLRSPKLITIIIVVGAMVILSIFYLFKKILRKSKG